MKVLRRLALLSILVLALGAREARADSASEAQLQYELGTELYKQGRYAEAIERFIASHRLVPNGNVVMNVARTFEYMNRHKDAYNWYETYLGLASPGEPGRAEAEARQRALLTHVAVLDVTTVPPGAELYVDRIDLGAVGRSPRRLAVEPGERRVIARSAGYREGVATAVIAAGGTQPVSLTLAPLVGALVVETTPAGATVRLEPEGAELGKTPLRREMAVGERRVTVSMPGFADQSRSVLVEDGRTSTLAMTLVRAASSVAVLTVSGNVPGASLVLDGRPLGKSPATMPDLPAGEHRLEVVASGRESWTTTLLLEPGAATRVEYDLVDPDERAWPGWRWIGYGAGGALVVAGGIVGATALAARSDFEEDPSREGLDTLSSRNLAADILLGAGVVVLGATVVWDLLSGPAPESTGKVSIDR